MLKSSKIEPLSGGTDTLGFVSGEDWDRARRPPGQIWVFAVRTANSSAQRGL